MVRRTVGPNHTRNVAPMINHSSNCVKKEKRKSKYRGKYSNNEKRMEFNGKEKVHTSTRNCNKTSTSMYGVSKNEEY